jgi:hypothetical protein
VVLRVEVIVDLVEGHLAIEEALQVHAHVEQFEKVALNDLAIEETLGVCCDHQGQEAGDILDHVFVDCNVKGSLAITVETCPWEQKWKLIDRQGLQPSHYRL